MRGIAHPPELKAKAIALRQAGHSLREIYEALGVPKITVQGWVAHIQLTEAQQQRIRTKEVESAARGRPLAVLAWRRKIEAWKAEIRQQVESLGSLPFGDPRIGRLACGLLYVCEGGKYPKSRALSFGNTDSRMIRTFLLLLRRHFPVDEMKFRVRVMHRWDQDGERLKRFWSEVTGIPLSQFYPAYVDQRTKGHPTRQAAYRGVCSVSYLSTTLQYTLQAIGESVLDLAGTWKATIDHPHAKTGMAGEQPPPRYQTQGFVPFPERDELWWLLDPITDDGCCQRVGGAGGT